MSDHPPEPSPRSPRAPVRIDLNGVPLDQFDAVMEHLRLRRHYHELRGDYLIVQARHEAEVRQVLADATPWSVLEMPAFLPAGPRRLAGRSAAEPDLGSDAAAVRPAPRVLRLAGVIVDGVVLALIARLVGSFVDSERSAIAWSRIAGEALAVIPVAIWGRTPGKLAVGTRIVGPDGGAPGWTRAIVRWVVPAVPVALALAIAPWSTGVAAAVGGWGSVAVFVGVLFQRERRGLHDLAAGTRVVRGR